MNIFNKVTLQSMRKSRTRTVVTIIGVILSAAMVTAVSTFAVSLQNYLVRGAIAKYGGWHVEYQDVDEAFIQEQTRDEAVESIAAMQNIGYANLAGGKNSSKPYLFITGFGPEAFEAFPVNLNSGRLPKNSGEVLIPAHVATNGGVNYALGDRLSISIGRRMEGDKMLGQHDPYVAGDGTGEVQEKLVPNAERTYTVVGFYDRPGFEEYTAPGYTLITVADPVEAVDDYSVLVTLKQPLRTKTYINDTTGGYGYVTNDNVLRFMGVSGDKLFNTLMFTAGGILIALIMIGSIFLIYNSFNISLNERTRQFGILSSVGATAKQLRNSVLFEGLCIGAIGIPIGVLVGIVSVRLVIAFVAENFSIFGYSSVPLSLKVSIPAILVSAAISLITILISAYIPARKAAGTPVMENIRQTNEVKVDPRTLKTSKLEERLYGFEGTLALRNFKRNKKRYRSIVLSLSLSVVLFVSSSAFGTHLKQAAERSVVDSDYDISFSTQGMDDSQLFQLYDQLKTADGVYESSYQAIMQYTSAVPGESFSDSYRETAGITSKNEMVELPMDIQFIEDRIFLRFIDSLGLSAEQYTGEDAKMIAVAKAKQVSDTNDGKTELIDMFANRSMDMTIIPSGDGEPASGQEQTIPVTFVDTIPIDTLPRNPSEVKPYVFMVVAPYQLKGKFENPAARTEEGLTFSSNDPARSVAEMEQMIQDAGIPSGYTLYNVYKLLEQNRNIIFVVDVFTYVFIIMISLIAIANVFNTISTNIRLRRRELAMLRSVGMSERDFEKMMNFECVFYGLRTLVFGVPIAAVISWLIYKGLSIGGAEIDFVFPLSSMGISVIGVFLIVFITMLYAVRQIKRENIIDALRDDMT
ncbi:MAG: putative transport system permease protein [Chloroflexota bacterium]|nr:putative transport system permease protein [Chloroflexota bacterium]